MSYIVLMIVTMILGIASTALIQIKYSKWNKIDSGTTMTGSDAARAMLASKGIQNPTINVFDGDELNDYYDPKNNSLNLARRVADGTSVAALAVACHEAGHYLQHSDGYVPMKVRSLLVPVANIGNTFSWIVLLAGILLSSVGIIKLAVLLYMAVIAFSVMTLPVEFNASRRAIRYLDGVNESMNGAAATVNGQEGTRSVLRAAAFTYVASTAAAIGNLLYILSVVDN